MIALPAEHVNLARLDHGSNKQNVVVFRMPLSLNRGQSWLQFLHDSWIRKYLECGQPATSLIVVRNAFVRLDVAASSSDFCRVIQANLVVVSSGHHFVARDAVEEGRAEGLRVAEHRDQGLHLLLRTTRRPEVEDAAVPLVARCDEQVGVDGMDVDHLGGHFIVDLEVRHRLEIRHPGVHVTNLAALSHGNEKRVSINLGESK